MLRVDGSYLYRIGKTVRALELASLNNLVSGSDLFKPLMDASAIINQLLDQSLYSTHLRTIRGPAAELRKVMGSILDEIIDDFDQEISVAKLSDLSASYQRFDTVLTSELATISTYLVYAKGAYAPDSLTDFGETMFPKSLPQLVPAAIYDVKEGATCLAYERWTASAFHFHRANETVLRAYFGSTVPKDKHPKVLTLGSMLYSMEKNELGDKNIRAALKNIKDLHRNPTIHDSSSNLENEDDALTLVASVRAAIGYMLDKIPAPIILPTVAPISNDDEFAK